MKNGGNIHGRGTTEDNIVNGNISVCPDRMDISKRIISFLNNQAPRIRAILIRPCEKIPLEQDWSTRNNYSLEDPRILRHIQNGGNWGPIHPSGMSCGVDEDTAEIRRAARSLGDTLGWNTGTPGHYCEIFIIKDAPIGNIPMVDGAYIRGRGGQNLGPGSIHPNGQIYGAKELHMVPPLKVTRAELLDAFAPFIIGTEKLDKTSKATYKAPQNPESMKVKDLIDLSVLRQHGSTYQGSHPIHGSETGKNFVVDIDKNLWHCFRHGTGGGALQWIAVSTGVISCSESLPGAIKGDLFWEVIAKAHDSYGLPFEKAAEMVRREQ